MDIRIADIKDVDLLAEMNCSLIRDEGHRNSMEIPELATRMERWITSEYVAAIFEDEGSTIGYALWRSDPDNLYIRQFYIRTQNRRLGKGSDAIQILKRNFWQGHRLRLEVLAGNTVAHTFWRNVGFSDYCMVMESDNA